MTETLAIIPCRGGSKRLPGKNIKQLCGRPLIAYAIDAALQAPSVTRVIVDTDDEEIREVAREWGDRSIPADCGIGYDHPCKTFGDIAPYLRPSHLATDDATSEDVILNCLNWLRDNEGYEPDVVCLLQATSPLRTAVDVEACLRLMVPEDHRGVISVHDGPFTGVERNGAVYASYVGELRKPVWSSDGWGPLAYKMPWERSVDVDTAEDFELAEWLMSQRGM